MKFSAARETLLKPLQAVIGVVERRQTMPILSNVLLIARDGQLSVTATDLEVELVAETDVETETGGEITVSGRKLLDICRALPEGTVVNVSLSGEKLAVKGGPRENLAKPLMTANFRKYRKGLSRGQVKIVEAYNGDLMDRFGYPREYTGLAKPGFFSALRPQLTEPLERFVNSDMRPQYNFGNSRLKKQLDANVTPLCPPLWDD